MIHVTNGILEGNMMQKAAIDLLIVGNFIFFLQSMTARKLQWCYIELPA